MEPKSAIAHAIAAGAAEEDLGPNESLDALEVEDLLGHHVDFDEQDDWRATEF